MQLLVVKGVLVSADSNKALVRRHIELAWNEADFDALSEVWAPDCVVHLANGRDVIGLDALIEQLIAAPDRATVEARSQALDRVL